MSSALTRVRDAWLVVRGKPLPGVQDASNARERDARMFLTSLSMVVLRVVSFTVNIVSIGVLHRYLDPVAFGLWLTLSSFWLVLVLFGDMGMAGSVVNGVARAAAVGDWIAARRVVSSTLPLLVIISSVLSFAFVILSLTLPWASVLRIYRPEIESQFPIAFMAMALSTALTPITGLAPAVMKGLQRGYAGNLLVSACFLLALGALLVGTQVELSFAQLAITFYSVPAALLIVLGVAYFNWFRREIRPSLRLIDRVQMRQAVSVGGALFGLQVFSSITSFSDSILISMVLGPESVPAVAVPARLFATVNLGVAILITPLWPAYADAIARGDMVWVKRTFKRSLQISLGFATVASLIMFALHEQILFVWMGQDFKPDYWVAVGLAVWCVIESAATAIAMLLNAAQVFRFQLITAACMMLASIALRIWLLKTIGPAGVPFASIGAYFLTTFIPLCLFLPTIVRSITERGSRA